MNSRNEELASLLTKMAVMLDILEDNNYRAKAYSRAATTVERLSEDICEVAARGELERLPGIGKTIARNITIWCRHSTFEDFDKVKARFPEGLFDLLKIPGLGPKKIKILYRSLGITSLGELEYACMENRLVEVKGFGLKTQDKILRGIEYVKKFGTYRRSADAYALAEKVQYILTSELSANVDDMENGGGGGVRLVGGLRRFQEIADDIDFLVYHDDLAFLLILEHKKLLSDLQPISPNHTRATFEGFSIDIFRADSPTNATPLLFYTGSKAHVDILRQRAKNLDIDLTSTGFKKNGSFIETPMEERCYEILNLPYIPPELREDGDAIKAADRGLLPELITIDDIQGVFHVHTKASDGSMSLEMVVREAIARGFKYVGISDHSQSAYYAGGLTPDRLMDQYKEVQTLRNQYPEIDIYWGIESDILPDGSLDYHEDILKRFDFVIGSVHSHFKMDVEEMTTRLIRALRNHFLTILGHPTGRLLLGRPPYEFHVESVLKVAADCGKIIELNAHPHRLDLDWRWCKKAREMGVMVSINPDAHKPEDFNIHYGVRTARKGWLERKDVWNTLSRDAMIHTMQRKLRKGF